jgi:hypothetical protein
VGVRSQRIPLAYKQNVRATVSEFTFLLAHISFRHFFLIEPSKAEYVADAPSLLLYSYAHTFLIYHGHLCFSVNDLCYTYEVPWFSNLVCIKNYLSLCSISIQ